jgi:hypothetical protein
MSCIFELMLRNEEMVAFNDGYNVHNGLWGLNNIGTDPVTVDSQNGAIAVATKGLYRVTGNICGDITPKTSDTSEVAQGYINLPSDQVQNNPAYSDPYYHGFQVTAQRGRVTVPFSGKLVLSTWPKFSIYLSKNFSLAGAPTILLFELVQS